MPGSNHHAEGDRFGPIPARRDSGRGPGASPWAIAPRKAKISGVTGPKGGWPGGLRAPGRARARAGRGATTAGDAMIRRMTILRKGLILIAVPLLFQLGFIALTARLRVENARAVDWAIHSKEVLALSEACRVGLLSAHGAIQGYILTRDPSLRRGPPEALDRGLAGPARPAPQARSTTTRTRRAPRTCWQSREAGLPRLYEGGGPKLVGSGGARPDLGRDPARGSARPSSTRWIATSTGSFNRERAEPGRPPPAARLDETRGADRPDARRRRGGLDRLHADPGDRSSPGTSAGGSPGLTENSRRLAEGRELEAADRRRRRDRPARRRSSTRWPGPSPRAAARERNVHAELLERRAEELAVVNAQLGEKARENEMFVYSVSHDLRSPLVNLQGFSKELGMIGKDLGPAGRRRGGSRPRPAARPGRADRRPRWPSRSASSRSPSRRLSGIIDGLLRLSRAGRVEYRRQEVAVAPIVARVVSALRGTIDERGASVDRRRAPAGPGATRRPIEQVFANLDRQRGQLPRQGPAGSDRGPRGGPRRGTVGPSRTGPDSGRLRGPSTTAWGSPTRTRARSSPSFQRLHADVAKGEGDRPGPGPPGGRAALGGRVWFESEAGRGHDVLRRPCRRSPPIDDEAMRTDDSPRVGRSEGEGGRMATEPMTLILAEDDDGHANLVQRNLRRAGFVNDLVHVKRRPGGPRLHPGRGGPRRPEDHRFRPAPARHQHAEARRDRGPPADQRPTRRPRRSR